ncbi:MULTISPECIES: sigma-70 family RNA polymerase sigma factor [Pseudobutyrivibrio]|uniref:RNA polymerase sigma factor SigS n=1 Tax=Pseudobutyrivibrio xylanivorans TaxID=185007 RepID=A0A1G5RV44_PSEXY|nr:MULTISPECIES: sigma-70 family RNA polymerase sigma factor [Pseudobutyrivibrio]MDC7278690.1 sigma-70 family RNA polymerase sigma factor [Butyrivibrio fibrisolvens]SCZ78015.1 RNA polymerase sporulation-specific sigma factor [Pseudobutyrivibrio xylanivorans]
MDLREEYGKFSDEELVKIYQSGNVAVVNYICEKYKPLVLKLSKKYFLIGGENEDLIQEGMIGLFGAIGDYDTSSEVTFYHFAQLCIDRQMIKAIEASNRKKHSPLNAYVSIYNEDGGELDEPTFTSDDPAELIIEAEENLDLIERLKKALSPMEKKVFDLYMQDYDYKEIAVKLEKPEKSIDNTLTRIKQKARVL